MASYFPMIKNSAQRIVFPILDADGDPVTGAAADTPDSEYSLDGASFSDCSDEIHEIATASGIYYLDLLAGETNGDVVCIQIKTATAGTKTTVLVFYTSAQSLDTIDTVVDGIQTDLSNATDGLGALKALLDTISGYTDKIDDATNGLTAIKAEVEGLGGAAMRGTDSAALATALATHDGKLDTVTTYVDLIDDATNGLAAIKAEVEGLAGAAMRGTDSAALAASWTATRAGYLDELAAANIPTDVDTLLTRLSAVRAGYLDELAAANIPADIDTLLTRLSAVRAGYIDNLSAGAAALEATLTAIKGTSWSTETLKAIKDAIDAISAASIADAVWDEALSGHVTDGTSGDKLGDIPLVEFDL